jgi:hypothetical protein
MSNQKLEATLWKYFSLFIRLRDSDKNGICRCITCGKKDHYKNMDAGHFITRNNKSTKYDEKNVHAQCKRDNRFLSGKQYEHSKMIDEIYGEGAANDLLLKSKMVCKRTDADLRAMIMFYKQKVKELEKYK